MLRQKVQAILKAKNVTMEKNTVSRTWIQNFRKKHAAEMKTAQGSGLDPKQAQAFNYETVHRHFKLLNKVLKDKDIPWENVYNMDEKGIQLGGGQKNTQERYFFSREDKMMYRQKSDSLELVTVIDCVCADSTAEIPPCFVFKGVGKFPEWMEVNDDILYVSHLFDMLLLIKNSKASQLLITAGQMMSVDSNGLDNASYLTRKSEIQLKNQFSFSSTDMGLTLAKIGLTMH
jgi:hypothetical protein